MIKSNKTKNSYKDRVDYDKTTFKWCLHQLSETDSGIYKFAVTNNDRVIADGSLALVVEGKGFFFFCVRSSCSVNLSHQEGRYVA